MVLAFQNVKLLNNIDTIFSSLNETKKAIEHFTNALIKTHPKGEEYLKQLKDKKPHSLVESSLL